MAEQPTYEELERQLQELKKRETERQETERRLYDEICRGRTLIEQSRDGILIITEDCKVYDTNKRFADMLGYSPEEMFELHVWDWDALFSKEQILEMVKTVGKSGDRFETQHRRKDGAVLDMEITTNGSVYDGRKFIFCICRDITERKRLEAEQARLIEELRQAMAEIRTLKGFLPICCHCKKIRADNGYWEQVDVYIRQHLGTEFTHGFCPECAKRHYPDWLADAK